MKNDRALTLLRNSLFALTFAFGAAVLASACAGDPEDGDVDDLFSDSPEAEEQDVCAVCPKPETCSYFGRSVCCVGADHPVACELVPTPDIWGTLPSPGGYIQYSASSYGSTACEDSYVIGYQPAVTNGEKWFDHATVFVAPGSVPQNPCDCTNTEVMLEVEGAVCVDGVTIPGSCCIDATCYGSCTSSSDCGPDYACVGVTPTKPFCVGSEIVRKTYTGTWSSVFGCVTSVTISRDDPSSVRYFHGELPQIRATAMDKRTGAEVPIAVRVHRTN